MLPIIHIKLKHIYCGYNLVNITKIFSCTSNANFTIYSDTNYESYLFMYKNMHIISFLELHEAKCLLNKFLMIYTLHASFAHTSFPIQK